MSEHDTVPRYAPTHVIIARVMKLVPVTGYRAYPPGTAPKTAPIKPEYTVLECQTAYGSRWYGFDRAYINSELRMIVVGFPARDEVRAGWPVVPEDKRI